MSGLDVHEECPHCDAAPPSRQLEMHVARQHADLPPCTARIEPEGGGLYTCAFRAGHDSGEYGTWHASKRGADMGRYIWNDTATGATPHQPPEPSDRLDKLKAAGVVSHTVVATGEGHLERPIKPTCAVLHTDIEGNTIPCPGYPHADSGPEAPPEPSELDQLRADNESLRYQILRPREALGTDEPVDERLRQAESRAAIAEHEAEAYKNQVRALVHELLRIREVPEEDLPQQVRVIILEGDVT